MGNLQLSGPVSVQSGGVFLHSFQKCRTVPKQGLVRVGLVRGDRIVVSGQEGGLVGLATGYVCDVSGTTISCTLDR